MQQYGGKSTEKQLDTTLIDFHLSHSFDADTVVLYEFSDYYISFESNAAFISNLLFKTETVLMNQPIGSSDLIYIKLSSLQAQSLIRDLLCMNQKKVKVFKQENRRWTISKQGTPGNLNDFEDEFDAVVPVIIALCIKQNEIGGCFLDPINKNIGLVQFCDNELFVNTESLLIQLNAKECLLVQNESLVNLDKMLKRCDIIETILPSEEFKNESILPNLLSEQYLPIDSAKYALALKASSALLGYMKIQNGEYSLIYHNLVNFMKLDTSAFKALNLFPFGNQKESLFTLLNQCKTLQGTRLLELWIRQPLQSIEQISLRHDLVEYFVQDAATRQEIFNCLSKLTDLQQTSRRITKLKAGVPEVVKLYQFLSHLPRMIKALGKSTDLVVETFTRPFEEILVKFTKFVELVEATVDFSRISQHEYVIKSTFDSNLVQLSRQKEEAYQSVYQEYTRIAHSLGIEIDKKIKLERNSMYGYFMRVTRNDSSVLRQRTDFIEYTTQKNGVYFVTLAMKKASEGYDEACRLYDKLQSSLVRDIVQVVSTYCQLADQLNSLVAYLDVICSFAQVSQYSKVPYTRPIMHSKGSQVLILKDTRHPCLEISQDFIANDAIFESNSMLQILTGPNMGGKSTYIRSVGLVVLMAQIGCFVPCSYAEITVVDAIMTRVGANDNQLKGISTFMAEMIETCSILKSSTKDSLVIVDELGRGTSTSDGYGLAYAIAKHLATRVKCFCFFATHFQDLSVIASHFPGIKNLKVTVSVTEDKVTLLYKVHEGVADQSYGVNVAALANIPKRVLKVAEDRIHLHNRFSDSEIEKGKQILQMVIDEAKRSNCDDALVKYTRELESDVVKFLLSSEL